MPRRVASLLVSGLLLGPLGAAAQKNFDQPPQMGRPSPPRSPAPSRNPRFTLINESQQTIDNLNISPSSDDSWGADLLGTLALPPHNRLIAGPTQDTGCTFDVRVVYHDHREEILRRQNLCELQDITFTGRNARPVTNRSED